MGNFGLKSNTVFHIYQDTIGYIWFCTNGGLSRYDGVSLKHIPSDINNPKAIPEERVIDIVMDHQGNYWTRTAMGFSVYHPNLPLDSATVRILVAPHQSNIPAFDDIPLDNKLVIDKKGNLWIGWGEKGLLEINPKTKTFYQHKFKNKNTSSFISIYAVSYLEESNSFLLSTGNHGIASYYIENDSLELYDEYLESELSRLWKIKSPILPTISMCSIVKSGIWCYHPGKPLVHFHLISKKGEILHTSGSTIEGDFHSALFEDSNDNLWLPTHRNGIFIINIHTGYVINKTQSRLDPYSMGSNIIYWFLEDKQKNIWLSHFIGGISKFSPIENPFKVDFPLGMEESYPPRNAILFYIDDDQGNEFIASTKGIFAKASKEKKYHWIGDFPFHPAKLRNQLFWLIDNDFYTIDANTGKKKSIHYTLNNSVKALLAQASTFIFDTIQNDDFLWVSIKQKGLYLIQLKNNRINLEYQDTILYGSNPIANPEQFRLDENHRVYMLLNGGFGIYDYKNKECKSWVYDPLKTLNMPAPPYYDFMVDSKNRIWGVNQSIGTFWFDQKNFHPVNQLIPNISKRGFKITEDKLSGELWFTTNRHLVRYNMDTKVFKVFTGGDGWRGMLSGANILFNKKGDLVLPGNDHISYLNPKDVIENTTPPKTVISNLKINSENYSELLTQSLISLNHQQNSLTFQFGSLNYIKPNGTHFSWKMEGIDPNWVTPSDNQKIATYNALPPGNYHFTVKSCTADGIWDQEGAHLQLNIRPAWWQTIWFKAFCITIFLGIIYLFNNQITIRKLDAQKAEIEKSIAITRERERIARDMHDDLGSGISAIQLLSNFLKNKPVNTSAELRKDLEKIASSSTDLNQKVREIIWTINASSDTAQSLFEFLRNYCMNLSELTNISIECTNTNLIRFKDKNVPGEIRRTLYLCAKEALNNSVKYASVGKILLNVEISNDKIIIIISDQGNGFDLNTAIHSSGNGVKNILFRMEEIKGTATYKFVDGTQLTLETSV